MFEKSTRTPAAVPDCSPGFSINYWRIEWQFGQRPKVDLPPLGILMSARMQAHYFVSDDSKQSTEREKWLRDQLRRPGAVARARQ